jgi:hypothetical protein
MQIDIVFSEPDLVPLYVAALLVISAGIVDY